MNQITRDNLRVLRIEMNRALKSVGDKYNVEINAGNVSFTDKNASFKLQVALINEDGIAETKEVQDFKAYSFSHGLPEDLLNKEINVCGKTVKIIGYKPRSTKFPFLVDEGNRVMKYPESAFKKYKS